MAEVILVARTDRAGDLVLTLPVFAALRAAKPEARILALVRRYTAPLLHYQTDIDGVILEDPRGKPLSPLLLASVLKKTGVTVAIIVHPSWRVILACRLAGIPIRIGRASNVWQIFLNRRMVQNRSANQKHESAYNLELLQGLGIYAPSPLPSLVIPEEQRKKGRDWLDGHGLTGISPIFVHPGHGGSAFNLSLRRYVQLVGELKKLRRPVAVTLGADEERHADLFRQDAVVLTGMKDLYELATILANGAAFIGGSTGPMHIAGAVGLPVVAFFPPFPTMTPRRWGPLGNPSLVVLPPSITCESDCSTCRFQPCMDRIEFGEAVNFLKTILPAS